MTALAGVSRATFYRFDAEVTPAMHDVDFRDAIHESHEAMASSTRSIPRADCPFALSS